MSLLESSRFFPPAELAGEEGLVLLGGELTPEWVLDAYRHGIFPWPIDEPALPLAWWSPDPRAILEFDALHVPRRLQRTLAGGRFRVTCDRDFSGVIAACATAGDRRREGTWLTPEMIAAYTRLHEMGHAHSVEVWEEGPGSVDEDLNEGANGGGAGARLAGGIYGVALGGLFAGESMFHLVRDASKVALVHLVAHLRHRGYALFDIQQLTEHTERFGATENPRREYLRRLEKALRMDVTFGGALEGEGRMKDEG